MRGLQLRLQLGHTLPQLKHGLPQLANLPRLLLDHVRLLLDQRRQLAITRPLPRHPPPSLVTEI